MTRLRLATLAGALSTIGWVGGWAVGRLLPWGAGFLLVFPAWTVAGALLVSAWILLATALPAVRAPTPGAVLAASAAAGPLGLAAGCWLQLTLAPGGRALAWVAVATVPPLLGLLPLCPSMLANPSAGRRLLGGVLAAQLALPLTWLLADPAETLRGAAASLPPGAVGILLLDGRRADEPDATSRTASTIAACAHRIDVVRVLLAHGADPSRPLACAADDPALTALLLAAGGRPDKSALEAVGYAGNLAVVEQLRAAGVPFVDAGAMRQAVRRRHPDLVLAMLDAGAPAVGLDEAAANGDTDLARLLLERGALHADPRGAAAAIDATLRGPDAQERAMLDLLADGGVPIDPGSLDGLAAPDGDADGVAWLLDHGVSPDGLPGRRTPLEAAATAREGAPALAILLDRGADARRGAVLARCADWADPALVERLLAAGADPNAADEDGHLPLWTATFAHHPDVVRVLLRHGADPGGVESGRTSRELAQALNDPALIALFEEQ